MKNTGKTMNKKLALNKNTLRQLSQDNLDQAVGGWIPESRVSCIQEASCKCFSNLC